MPNITVSVPDWLYKEMQALDYINWSAVARTAFIEKIKKEKG